MAEGRFFHRILAGIFWLARCRCCADITLKRTSIFLCCISYCFLADERNRVGPRRAEFSNLVDHWLFCEDNYLG